MSISVIDCMASRGVRQGALHSAQALYGRAFTFKMLRLGKEDVACRYSDEQSTSLFGSNYRRMNATHREREGDKAKAVQPTSRLRKPTDAAGAVAAVADRRTS